MNESIIRKKLVDYIQVANEKKVQALNVFLEGDIEPEFNFNLEQYNTELKSAEKELVDGKYFNHSEITNQIKNGNKNITTNA